MNGVGGPPSPHALRKWSQRLRVFWFFAFFCFQSPDFCVLGERQAQDPLKAQGHTELLHPSQDPTQLLPLARVRSRWGWGAAGLYRLLQGKQTESLRAVDDATTH